MKICFNIHLLNLQNFDPHTRSYSTAPYPKTRADDIFIFSTSDYVLWGFLKKKLLSADRIWPRHDLACDQLSQYAES